MLRGLEDIKTIHADLGSYGDSRMAASDSAALNWRTGSPGHAAGLRGHIRVRRKAAHRIGSHKKRAARRA